ncbi:MAG: trigger factor, partial [Methyloprofundus sp.]
DIRTVIDGMAQSYEDSEQVVNWYYGDKDRLAEIEQMVLEDATIAWVLEKIKVTDEVVSFKEIMGPAA